MSQASAQQAQDIDQVSQAIAEMETLTQKTAGIAEQNSATSAELSDQSQHSLSQVHRLDTLVGAVPSQGVGFTHQRKAAPSPQVTVPPTAVTRPRRTAAIPFAKTGTGW